MVDGGVFVRAFLGFEGGNPMNPLRLIGGESAQRLLLLVAILAVAKMAGGSENAEPIAGFHLLATDSGANPQASAHLQLGSAYRINEAQVDEANVSANDAARSILYDGTAIVLHYRGLQSEAHYKLRLVFLSDHPNGPRFPQRVVRVLADKAALAERVEIPKGEKLVVDLDLPPEVYRDGEFTLRIEKIEGHNAVVSRVELWSDRDEPLPDIKLPAIFASGMVLQRDRPIPVWGHAAPGQQVTVAFGDHQKQAQADDRGRWQVTLPATAAGGPFPLTITGKQPLVLQDVLVGDVWICSGQSNMEMPLKQDKHFAEEKAHLANPRMRLFKVPALWSAGPANQMIGNWQPCNETTAPEFSAVGYYFGKQLSQELDVPIGLVQAAIGGTPIENWTPGPTGHWYNGMMSPMLPFAIRGAIWYQGESNIESGVNYLRQMHELIGGWRKVWGQGQFPVYFVQLAPFKHRDDPTLQPIIWEAQLKSLQIPNTGMAVTTDIGEGDLHPPEKREVGNRLALWALANTYGQKQVEPSGPLYRHYEINGDKIVLHFDHVGGGLAARDGKPLDWFEIAGADGKFVPATATIEGDTVVVTSAEVAQPVAVRFGWHQLAEPNLINRQGLPASPFRTE
jgi:sialate O-acetylesterase